MKYRYSKKQLRSICQNALEKNADLDIESAMYTDVENRIHLGGDKYGSNWRSF